MAFQLRPRIKTCAGQAIFYHDYIYDKNLNKNEAISGINCVYVDQYSVGLIIYRIPILFGLVD